MSEVTKVVDLFAGAGVVGAVCAAVVLVVLGGFGWWVRHRRNERRHEEESRRLDHRDWELAMIARAAFTDAGAVDPLARLLSTSSPPGPRAKPSSPEVARGQ